MKTPNIILSIVLALSSIGGAEEKKASKGDKKAKAEFSTEYEGKTYEFSSAEGLAEWKKEREASLYHQIGGKAAVDAAVDLFYTKVLADETVNGFFDDVNMKTQHRKQKEFISAALGGPIPWEGKDMREAHKDLDLRESDFTAIAGHLQATLEELKVPANLVSQIMAVVGSTKEAVLNQ